MSSGLVTIASAIMTADVRVFRALLEEANAEIRIAFAPDTPDRLCRELNLALAEAGAPDELLLVFEATGTNHWLFKNARGAIIKFVNQNGLAVIDTYYSYSAVYKKPQKPPKLDAAAPAYQRALKQVARERRSHTGMRVLQSVTAAFCMLAGFAAVQAIFYFTLHRFGVDYASIFGSLIAGFILYASIGEALMHFLMKNYGERQEFGEGGHPATLFLLAVIVDVALHAFIFAFMSHTVFNTLTICASILFFIYPGTYFASVFWSMKREVSAINTGRLLINRRHYANVPIPAQPEDLLPVTISIACYTEDNQVIFDNIKSCVPAAADYTRESGKAANIIVSDDGLPTLLGGDLCAPFVRDMLMWYQKTPENLSPEQRQGAERILFYREAGVAFVCRPRAGRNGKFKKSGNLNFSYRLARGEETGGYSEGEIIFHDLILMLDKDSIVKTGILQAAVPEFLRDPKLAYAQSVTLPSNQRGNYFSRVLCQHFYLLQNMSLPLKSLQGLITPLMGHNVFLRRSFLEESGFWPEDRVSEDFAKSIDAQLHGYHGKYIAFKGLEFGEYVGDTFAEETGKQLRYCYGLLELLTLGHRKIRQLTPAHWLDLGSYFFSYINIAAIIPMFLIMLRFDIFHLVFGGIIVNAVIYFLLPLVLYAHMQHLKNPTQIFSALCGFVVIGLTFFAHNYSVLRAFFEFIKDRIRIALGKSYAAFPSSQVNTLTGTFSDGLRLIGKYYRKNLPVPILSVLFFWGGIRMLSWLDSFVPAVVFPAIAQLLFAFAVPLLTPQLFVKPVRAKKRTPIAPADQDVTAGERRASS